MVDSKPPRFVLTRKVRESWKEFVSNRPGQPIAIEKAVLDLIPATGDGLPFVTDDAILLSHPDYPRSVFVAKYQFDECVLIGMLSRRSTTRPLSKSDAEPSDQIDSSDYVPPPELSGKALQYWCDNTRAILNRLAKKQLSDADKARVAIARNHLDQLVISDKSHALIRKRTDTRIGHDRENGWIMNLINSRIASMDAGPGRLSLEDLIVSLKNHVHRLPPFGKPID